jgi:phosphotransferase family enzyme
MASALDPQPDPEIARRVAAVLGWRPERWRRTIGGYTPAQRFVASAGERSVFVKVAVSPVTVRMLRQESVAYRALRAPFVPGFIAFEDDDAAPLLIIEDLAAARWPPPWDATLVADVAAAIEAMHRTPADLTARAELHLDISGGWAKVATDPGPFLALGGASEAWLDSALPTLVAAEAACQLEGDALCHFDLRSDNICRAPGGVKFVDWSAACLGNPLVDLGGWLPSLQYEGGPAPEAIIGHAPEVAAWVSGYFAARAGLANIPDAPFVRRVQREQLSTALPWAIRALGLPPL